MEKLRTKCQWFREYAVLNTKFGNVENKIHDHARYITTSEFNNVSDSIFDTKLKKTNLATFSHVNAISQCTNKNKEKIKKLQTLDLSYFLGKLFLGDNGFQNMFVCQPKFSTIDFKQENEEYKVSAWIPKGVNSSNILPLHKLLPTIKYYDHKIGLQFNNAVLVTGNKQLHNQDHNCLQYL